MSIFLLPFKCAGALLKQALLTVIGFGVALLVLGGILYFGGFHA